MIFFNVTKHFHIKLGLVLLMAFILNGCSITQGGNSNNYAITIEGRVSSFAKDIPNNSNVIITISRKKPQSNSSLVIQEFAFLTSKSAQAHHFRFKMSDDILLSEQQVYLSARIEKEDELQMMSDNIITVDISKIDENKKIIKNILLTVTPS
ncbi:hypothetical protein [Yersinia ruckeri]|nr:hypothetical protein [Yersinia ruckeri]AKA39334.1 hypothetical protein UGYR_13660 [Yersinia ruckeri]ARZ02158.1 hypothetical protein QMA0440_02849 [Yersinia ruckeri]AUQ40858.1 hypothetical protein NJ56_02260 [Yersinia ruckeri]EKN4182892.1 hypothetical protein [Yersinia ruckeri]EKN4691357.1 hypothetical protein [Yersinia ruckeri]